MYELNICHLYPDILNLYGDRGNIFTLQKRLEWRGMKANITNVSIGDSFSAEDFDIFFIGGGQDFEQEILLRDLEKYKAEEIKRAVEAGKVFLAICGGYQILGHSYTTWDGVECRFIGAINVKTVGKKERMIGNYMFKCDEADGGVIVGFENHSGMTFLGEGVSPLGTVICGNGNNGQDKTEGARYKNVFCTYSHGSLLPKNPKLADRLLNIALRNKYGQDVELAPLDDTVETRAHDYMQRRLEDSK